MGDADPTPIDVFPDVRASARAMLGDMIDGCLTIERGACSVIETVESRMPDHPSLAEFRTMACRAGQLAEYFRTEQQKLGG